MSHVIPVTQARKNLLKLVDMIDEQYTRVDLTKRGKIKATLVSSDYLDSLEETIYSLKHSLKDIKLAQKQFREGKFVTFEEFKKRLKTP
jgi:PHD/YefM family antitoxin component YafN of YafNO toxin-antitoxin module